MPLGIHAQLANNFDYSSAKYIAIMRLLRLFAAILFPFVSPLLRPYQ